MTTTSAYIILTPISVDGFFRGDSSSFAGRNVIFTFRHAVFGMHSTFYLICVAPWTQWHKIAQLTCINRCAEEWLSGVRCVTDRSVSVTRAL